MYASFPRAALALLRCPADGHGLEVLSAESGNERAPIRSGVVGCHVCTASYRIEDGILSLLEPSTLEPLQAHEARQRDQDARGVDANWDTSDLQLAEKLSTLETLGEVGGRRILEVGSGTGRYTVEITRSAGLLVAVDLSREALKVAATRLPPGAAVALVHADGTRLNPAPASFEGALATLVSNLPSAPHRSAFFDVCAKALVPGAPLVFSTHHYGWRQRLARVPKSGHYDQSRIYRYFFTPREIVHETRQHFSDVRCRPIAVRPPLVGRLGLPLVPTYRLAESVPLVRGFGNLLLVTATNQNASPKRR
jgi:SAM-dependent methyltransferase